MKAKSCIKLCIEKCVLLAILLFSGMFAHAQPSAMFSGTNISGCAPILTHFTDESTGNPNYWKWDLGNGTISYLQNPSVTYFTPGTYNVKLIVKSTVGQDSIVKSSYVHVYAAPVVDFVASQTIGCDSIIAQFTDRSTAANAWQWDFGDGIFSSEHNPIHTYSQNGSYNVSLKVINGEGCSLTLVKQEYINVNSVKAAFGYTIQNRCIPTTLHFQNTSVGSGRLTYKWYFGNGDSSISDNPVYNYPSAGSYTQVLKVSNEFGCAGSHSNNITVATPVSASFIADVTSSCNIPATIRFTNQQLQNNNYTWDFGDTTYAVTSNPIHAYHDTGSYTVKLIIRNSNGCIDSVIKTNYIKVQKPFVSLSNLPDSGCTGMRKTFTVSSLGTDNATNFLWNFGDGVTSTLQNPSHIFTGERYFTVSLITTGASGCRDTTVVENAIHTGFKPHAGFSSDTQMACAQTKIEFTDNTQGNVKEWQWNFGDNGQAFEQNPKLVIPAIWEWN
jgi:PKD repeat protein